MQIQDPLIMILGPLFQHFYLGYHGNSVTVRGMMIIEADLMGPGKGRGSWGRFLWGFFSGGVTDIPPL